MIIRRKMTGGSGYTPITDMNGQGREMLMDFGILNLQKKGERFSCNEAKERALMLMTGEAELRWGVNVKAVKRQSLLIEKPVTIYLPPKEPVEVVALSDNVEFAVLKNKNDISFEPKLFTSEETRESTLTSGNLGNVAERIIRTVIDDENEPCSGFCFGEIINNAGRWSSYPPHYHPQPEIYHYRFFPEEGFGYSGHGDEVYKVHNGDTAAITPNVTHPQVAAPGYTMYYVWAIPHLKNDRFISESRIFEKTHTWVLDK